MATVWSGTHRNGMRVAIKALRVELSHDPAVRDRFLREGYVANRVAHPGVVSILDDDVSEDDIVFLVMELLEGMTLKELWKERNRQLPPSEVVTLTRAMLEVLAAAHDKNVVHRDIKPDNVFIMSQGGVRILDFGIARLREIDAVDQRTRTGNMLGTPAFMPPEQALGHWDEVDARTDLFAVGATMWTLLTGTLVHRTKTLQELLVAAATKRAPPIATLLPTIDPRLAAVIDKALEFDREDRWSSASAMAEGLARVTRGRAVTEVMPVELASDTRLGAHGSWLSLGHPAWPVQHTPTTEMPAPLGHDDTRALTQAGPEGGPTPTVGALDAGAQDTATPTTQPLVPQRRRDRWPLIAVAAGGVAALAVAAIALTAAINPARREPGPRRSSAEPRLATAVVPSSSPAAPTSSPPVAPSASPGTPAIPLPRAVPRPLPPAPKPPPTPPAPRLDCAGADFSNPACARRATP